MIPEPRKPREPILWPTSRARFDHAKKTGDYMLRSIADWTRETSHFARFAIADDSMGVDLIFEGFEPPPAIDEWGVAFGAIAHQYRVILDNAVEYFARQLKLPKNFRRHFPITTTAKAWSKEAGELKGFPPRVVDTIRAAQPFVHTRAGRDPRDHVLAVLAWIDNLDKHDQLIDMSFRTDRLRAAANATMVAPDVDFDAVATMVEHRDFTVGRPVVSIRTAPHQIDQLGRADVWLLPSPEVSDWAGNRTPIVDQLDELYQIVFHTMVALSEAWEDPNFDTRRLAGATDQLQGSSFGPAAVDGLHGQGVWAMDYRHRYPHEAASVKGQLDPVIARMHREAAMPKVWSDVDRYRPIR